MAKVFCKNCKFSKVGHSECFCNPLKINVKPDTYWSEGQVSTSYERMSDKNKSNDCKDFEEKGYV